MQISTLRRRRGLKPVWIVGVALGVACPFAFLACSTRLGDDQRLGVAQQALLSNVGDTCDAAADASGTCVANAHCWILDNPDATITQQRCHCDPGYTACGDNCVEISVSSANCGHCGYSCDGGSCVNGKCGGSLPDASWTAHLGSIDEVSAYDASTSSSTRRLDLRPSCRSTRRWATTSGRPASACRAGCSIRCGPPPPRPRMTREFPAKAAS
ncbi:MAG TPA: hypothetical protein VGM56_27325 [Byssovorax sp.]|jgi:hypothetical protein